MQVCLFVSVCLFIYLFYMYIEKGKQINQIIILFVCLFFRSKLPHFWWGHDASQPRKQNKSKYCWNSGKYWDWSFTKKIWMPRWRFNQWSFIRSTGRVLRLICSKYRDFDTWFSWNMVPCPVIVHSCLLNLNPGIFRSRDFLIPRLTIFFSFFCFRRASKRNW